MKLLHFPQRPSSHNLFIIATMIFTTVKLRLGAEKFLAQPTSKHLIKWPNVFLENSIMIKPKAFHHTYRTLQTQSHARTSMKLYTNTQVFRIGLKRETIFSNVSVSSKEKTIFLLLYVICILTWIISAHLCNVNWLIPNFEVK